MPHSASKTQPEALLAILRATEAWRTEIAPALKQFGDPAARLRLIIPSDAVDALNSGALHWIEAKDGSGLLPTLQDDDGRFARQVRLVDVGATHSAIEAARAIVASLATQAALREISAKLERVERKLDQLLAYQEAEQVGELRGAIKRLKDLRSEPGDADYRTPALVSIERDLSKVIHVGFEQIKKDVAALDPPRRGFWALNAGWAPAERHAEQLDAIMRKIELCFVATKALAEVDLELSRPMLARRRLAELRDGTREALEKGAPVYEFARYSSERESFWMSELPALAGRHAPLVIETTAGSLCD